MAIPVLRHDVHESTKSAELLQHLPLRLDGPARELLTKWARMWQLVLIRLATPHKASNPQAYHIAQLPQTLGARSWIRQCSPFLWHDARTYWPPDITRFSFPGMYTGSRATLSTGIPTHTGSSYGIVSIRAVKPHRPGSRSRNGRRTLGNRARYVYLPASFAHESELPSCARIQAR